MEVMRHGSRFLLPPSLSRPEVADGPAMTYALVVLNQRIPRFTPLLWNNAKMRVFADGGANRVYDGMPELFPDEDSDVVRRRYKPDVIKGDMDSIRPEVKDFYLSLGVKIVDKSYDQDTTDLHKCITYICNTTESDISNMHRHPCVIYAYNSCHMLCILVAGALGGRFDHEAGNINVLYQFSHVRIILLSDDCLIHLLPKTHSHEIYIHSSVEGPHCGLIPIGAPSARTTTTGLQWNLTDTKMNFGGLVSTSNLVREERITVHSDSDLLWTISIKKDV